MFVPFEDHLQGPPRHFAFERATFNLYADFLSLISGVEMGGPVVVLWFMYTMIP